jgi:hypothetical protein
MIDALCAVCGRPAVLVYVYVTTAGVELERDNLCREHAARG